jgi:hypothetical protein
MHRRHRCPHIVVFALPGNAGPLNKQQRLQSIQKIAAASASDNKMTLGHTHYCE